MKKTVALILTIVLSVTRFLIVCSAETTLSVDSNGYYLISNSDELYQFAEIVNNGEEDADAKLICDIVVNKDVLDENGNLKEGIFKEWYPIGDKNNYERINGSKFNGIFDGQGYTIYGLYYQSADEYRVDSGIGLFGTIGTGTVKNLKIKDTYFEAYYHIGGICGYLYEGKIIDCDSYAVVKGSSSVSGVCGATDSNGTPTFNNCDFYGTATGASRVSGICSSANESIFEYCDNYGKIVGNGSNVAGIVSGIGDYDAVSTVRCCSNYGSISTVSSSYNYIGGICSFSTNTLFEDCLNAGDITSTSSSSFVYVGGISGYGWGNIRNCLSYGTITVTSTNDRNNIGGIFGSATNNTKYQTVFENNYYRSSIASAAVFSYGTSGTIISEENVAEAVDDNLLLNGTVLIALNNGRVSDAPWGQSIGLDKHPVLLEKPVVYISSVGNTEIDYSDKYIYTDKVLLNNILDIVEILEIADYLSVPSYKNSYCQYYGTGSLVDISLDGKNIESYTLIVFGDVNGDSVADVLDAATAERACNQKQNLNEYSTFAVDTDRDGYISVSDYQQLINKVLIS